MAKYHLTNLAVSDLAEIWNYTYEEWSEKQANKYYKLLLESCQELANYPAFRKNYDLVEHGLLGYKASPHIIFFRIISVTEIEILRILHQRMDLKSKL